jgi:hypothetical protein
MPARRRVHAVFVLDDAGRSSGVASDFDLLAWVDGRGSLRAMQEMTAGELMTSPVETIGADADPPLRRGSQRAGAFA